MSCNTAQLHYAGALGLEAIALRRPKSNLRLQTLHSIHSLTWLVHVLFGVGCNVRPRSTDAGAWITKLVHAKAYAFLTNNSLTGMDRELMGTLPLLSITKHLVSAHFQHLKKQQQRIAGKA